MVWMHWKDGKRDNTKTNSDCQNGRGRRGSLREEETEEYEEDLKIMGKISWYRMATDWKEWKIDCIGKQGPQRTWVHEKRKR